MVSHLANFSKSHLHPVFFKVWKRVKGAVWGILKETGLWSQWCCPLFGRPKWTLGRTQCLSAFTGGQGHRGRPAAHPNLTSTGQSPPTTFTLPALSKSLPFFLQFLKSLNVEHTCPSVFYFQENKELRVQKPLPCVFL